MKAPDCRYLVCSSVHVPDEQSLGKAERLQKPLNFSSGSRKAIGRHESNQTIFLTCMLCTLMCEKCNIQAVWLSGYFSTAQSEMRTSQTMTQWNLGFWDILYQFHRHNIKMTTLSLWCNTFSIKLPFFFVRGVVP